MVPPTNLLTRDGRQGRIAALTIYLWRIERWGDLCARNSLTQLKFLLCM